MKLKDLNIIVWGGVILLLAMISKLVWWWFVGGEKPTTETPQPSVAPSPQVDTSPFATSQLGQLWSTLDWKTTAVGQHLAQYIPDDLINWVLWPAVVFFLWLIALRIIQTITGKKSTETFSLVQLIVAMLMIGGFGVLIAERWNKDSDPLPKQVVFKFYRAVPGMSETKMMGLNTTAIIVMPTAALGQKPHSFCAAITHPSEGEAARTAKFEVAPGGKGNVGHLRLTQTSKEKLLRSGVTVYDTTVTVQDAKEDGSHPCP